MTNSTHDSQEDVQNDEVIGLALRRSLAVLAVLVVLAVGGVVIPRLFRSEDLAEVETEISLPQARTVEPAKLPHLPMTDITDASRIDWIHQNGMEGGKLLPETMGGAVAVFDYDLDGDLDILFVGGKSWDWAEQPIEQPRSLCLYENDGHGKFRDVTMESGLQFDFYGMGPAVGDYDNDGWPDLFVTAVGKNYLFHNVKGKFEQVTETAGLSGDKDAWSTGAVWFDYDRDGLLDLFVCDYVVWSRELDLSIGFSLVGIGRAFGQPTLFTGTQSHLYHNEGEGRFKDVSEAMGIHVSNPNTGVPVGKALGVAAVDVNHDGWQDLIVANDTVANFLFMNYEGKKFEESGIPLGIALDRSGTATGAMGIDCSYFRNDDSLAIAIGNFANEQSSLFVSSGPEPPFRDEAMSSGLGPMSRLNLTFGMFFADLDLDSRLDIVCANGHLEAEINKVQSTQQHAQPPQFFWNAGSQGKSELMPLKEEQLGNAAQRRMVGRGAAYGDLDGDGDLDIVLVANGGKPRVLRNDAELSNHWIRLRLEGAGESNRDALGALVLVKAGDVEQRRIVSSTRSYLSQCEPTLTFGLGNQSQIELIQVTWPSGRVETFECESDQEHRLLEGTGTQVSD